MIHSYIYIVLNKTPIKPAICGSVNFDSTNMVNCLLGKTQVYGSACALFISLAAKVLVFEAAL